MALKATKATTYTADTIDAVKPADYVSTYTPGTYTSQYTDQINSAMNDLLNWSYDPLQDASYQALAKVYAQKGEIAAKNSLADAASLNGGYGTSYAVSAAQQARNQYNQELASYIPDLETNAYNRAQNKLTLYQNADDTAYARYRDTENDKQYLENLNYQKYRDLMSDYQWDMSYNQNATQFIQSLNQTEKWNADTSKQNVYSLKKNNSSGGGGKSSGGYVSTATGSGYSGAQAEAKVKAKAKTGTATGKLSTPTGNSGNWKGTSNKKTGKSWWLTDTR